jgi:hypothetical protein
MFLNKFLKKETIPIHPPAGLITDITDLDEFKQRLGIRSRAKTLAYLIKYLDTLPEQSWNVNKTFRSNSGKIRSVGIYDRTYEDATALFEQFGGGKYTILCIAPRLMKVGYYEFEGEDRYPEEEETPVKPKRLRLKYKPRDFKEALLLKRLEEGDEQLIRQITNAELSSQGILRNDSDMPVIQQQAFDLGWGRALSTGVDLFENLFLDTDTGSGGQINTGCSKKWFQRFRRDPGGIHLVIGKQRGGESALCFFLTRATGLRPIYAITAADEVLPGGEVNANYVIDY